MRRDCAVAPRQPLEGDTDGEQDAIPDHQEHRGGAGMTRRQGHVAGDEDDHGRSENHQIPAGK